MCSLNLPNFDVKVRKTKIGFEIFDVLRKKYVALTPEEWVRQHFIHYLISEKKYPPSLMNNEIAIKLNSLNKRCDTVVYDRNLNPLVICEYKKPNTPITQETINQIIRYNIVLKVKYLIISNGMNHYCCRLNYSNLSYEFIDNIPDYSQIIDL